MPELINPAKCCDTCASFMEVLKEYREQYGCDGYCMHLVALSESKELEERFKRMCWDTCEEWVAARPCELLRMEVVEHEQEA